VVDPHEGGGLDVSRVVEPRPVAPMRLGVGCGEGQLCGVRGEGQGVTRRRSRVQDGRRRSAGIVAAAACVKGRGEGMTARSGREVARAIERRRCMLSS
jgi:hypothetical protein